MYNFHYNYMMKEYSNVKLLFTDTDSFCYHITTENDLYKDIKGNKWYDFSNYLEVHNNFDETKHLIPGYFKDEFAGQPLLEFVGLRPKMYSIQPLEGAKKATAKGADRKVRDEHLSHQEYKQSLFGEQQFTHSMVRIAQEKHKLYTVEMEKKSLSPFSDKKYITRNGDDFTTYSYGHYSISNQ